MKTIKLFSLLLALLVAPMFGVAIASNLNQTAAAEDPSLTAALPDLRVSVIATPGGLKAGHCNKVRVNVTNSQSTGVSNPIIVHLFITQNGQQPTSHTVTLENGIGPNDNYGQPAWFHNVPIAATGTVTIRAKVNPDFEIEESVLNNNDKIKNFNVVGHCGSSGETASSSSGGSSSGSSGGSSGSSRGGSSSRGGYNGNSSAMAPFSIMAYDSRQRLRGGKKAPVSGAEVTLIQGKQKYTGTTGKNGEVDIKAPKGYYTMKIAKKGCSTVTRKYRLPSKSVRIAMSCR